MDTLFWTQCNPDKKVRIQNATKQFFGKFMYRLELYAPGGRVIYSRGDLKELISARQQIHQNRNYGGWWGRGPTQAIAKANPEMLALLREIMQDKDRGLKFRIEEPNIQIYAKTEDTLKSLVKFEFCQYRSEIVSISGPANKEIEAILESGAIIRAKPEYKYKVTLRDGSYSKQSKLAIFNYIKNLGEDMVKITPSVGRMLTMDSPYIWNCYFYTNDLDLITFVRLMAPNIISNTHELVSVADK